MSKMAAKLHCTIITPEGGVLDERAEMVVVTLYDGEMGIAPGHSPLVGRLGYGECRLRCEGELKRLYVDGGFVQVANNRVTLLTARAIPPEEIDQEAAHKQIEEALKRRGTSPEAMEIRDRLLAQARGQIRVAQRVQ